MTAVQDARAALGERLRELRRHAGLTGRQHAEWQRLLRRGMRAHQDTVIARDARTRIFRAFEPTVVPGLLQTADYARARFEQGIAEFGVQDVDEAVAARLRRQEMLYRADKRFHLVLT